MYSLDAAASRIKRALVVAEQRGVPDFVINARIDPLLHGGEFEEVLERGKAYLDAGATTVFVLGGKRGITADEIKAMLEAFNGRLNIGMQLSPNAMDVKQLSELGVARISVGPQLQNVARKTFKEKAEMMMGS